MNPMSTLAVVSWDGLYRVINAYGDVLFTHSDKKVAQEWRDLHA